MLRIRKFIKKPSNWPAVGIVLLMILALVLSMSSIALAAGEYLMVTPGATAIVNEAYFAQGRYIDSAGTGIFKPFLRVHQANADVEKGYNSDYNGSNQNQINYPEFHEDVGWTNGFLLKDVPQVPLSNITGLSDGIYREFHLDINQNTGGPGKVNRFLSWDVFDLYISDYEVSADLRRYADAPGIWNYTANFPDEPSRYVLVWSLDGDGDSWLKMDYSLEAGSGKSDIVAYIPESAFAAVGYNDDTYVIAYVEYGREYPNNDGFEELKVRKYPATKSGYKFEDLSADGNWDALEDPIEGWEIRAYVDTNPDGVLDQDEYDAGPAQLYDNGGDAINFTDANGAYSFLLEEGDYIIVEVLPSDWYQSPPGGTDSPSDDVVGTVTTSGEVLGELGYAINLGNGELDDNNNFGNYLCIACIEGYKLDDCTDEGIEGFEIELYEYEGALLGGNYTVCVNETSVAGWVPVGDTCIDVLDLECVNATGINFTNTPLECVNATGINFTNTPLLCISGNKTNEITGLGLAGWTIQLKDDVGMVIATTTTAGDGSYSFCDLEAGNYTVCEVVEAGWVAVSPECVDVELVCGNATVDFINTQPQQTCGTAVAAMYPGTPTPGVFWPFSTKQSNWFTYITYNKTGDGTETVYPIYYGQDQLAILSTTDRISWLVGCMSGTMVLMWR